MSKERIDILFKMHADIKDMKRMNKEAAISKKQFGAIGKMLKSGLGMTIGITSIGMLATAVKNLSREMITMGALLRDNAKALGVSAEFLQVWRQAAEQNSVSQTAADTGLQRFTRRLG